LAWASGVMWLAAASLLLVAFPRALVSP